MTVICFRACNTMYNVQNDARKTGPPSRRPTWA